MSDVSGLDPSQVDQLAQAVDELSDEQLNEVMAAQPGGYEAALDQAFAGMVRVYNAERAAGREAVIVWNVETPEGTKSHTVRCGSTCTTERGAPQSPTLTIGLSLPDFFRLILGKLDGMQAFMSGKLKLGGDVMLAQLMQSWFERPGGTRP
jgi:hypothetical protein